MPVVEGADAAAVDEGSPSVAGQYPAATPLAVGPFTGPPDKVLKQHANEAIAVSFDIINQLRRDALKAREIGKSSGTSATELRGLAISMLGEKAAGTLANRLVEFTVGSKLDINLKVKSQEDIPRWDDLPVEVRADFEGMLQKVQAGQWQRPIEGIDE